MYRSILVPIDISEADLTRHVIPQVLAHAKTAKVHFLAVIPTVPPEELRPMWFMVHRKIRSLNWQMRWTPN